MSPSNSNKPNKQNSPNNPNRKSKKKKISETEEKNKENQKKQKNRKKSVVQNAEKRKKKTKASSFRKKTSACFEYLKKINQSKTFMNGKKYTKKYVQKTGTAIKNFYTEYYEIQDPIIKKKLAVIGLGAVMLVTSPAYLSMISSHHGVLAQKITLSEKRSAAEEQETKAAQKKNISGAKTPALVAGSKTSSTKKTVSSSSAKKQPAKNSVSESKETIDITNSPKLYKKAYPETATFIGELKNADKYNSQAIDISKEVKKGSVPMFIQWDSRWGYRPFAGGYFGLKGSGATCLSMVYSATTGKSDKNPYAMGQWQLKQKFYSADRGTFLTMFSDGAKELGMKSKMIKTDRTSLQKTLEEGNVTIARVTKGTFTKTESFIVITSYQNGKVKVNDPNSIIRSTQLWDIEKVVSQCSAIYSYSIK